MGQVPGAKFWSPRLHVFTKMGSSHEWTWCPELAPRPPTPPSPPPPYADPKLLVVHLNHDSCFLSLRFNWPRPSLPFILLSWPNLTQRLHVFPSSAPAARFPALGTGSTFMTLSISHDDHWKITIIVAQELYSISSTNLSNKELNSYQIAHKLGKWCRIKGWNSVKNSHFFRSHYHFHGVVLVKFWNEKKKNFRKKNIQLNNLGQHSSQWYVLGLDIYHSSTSKSQQYAGCLSHEPSLMALFLRVSCSSVVEHPN